MLDFRRIQLEDKCLISNILKSSTNMASDSAFGTMFIWSEAYNLEICEYNNFLFRRYGEKKNAYSFPIGNGNLKTALSKLFSEFYDQEGFSLTGLTLNMVEKLNEFFPSEFYFRETPNKSDYIYRVSDLSLLAGRKYHSKRNSIANFEKKYNWKYATLTDKNISDCKKILSLWIERKKGILHSSENETYALKKTFDNYNDLNFVGGIIKVDEIPVAFTIGEKINQNVFVVHFEKADPNYQGLYAVINREFVKNELYGKYVYVNREEDLGIAGLRKAKLSYHPEIILSRFDAFPQK